MKKRTFISLMMCLAMVVLAQESEAPYIEVTGTPDMHVIPDEIFISITKRERNSGNHRTVKEQEEALKTALKGIGLNLDDLEFSDADADYVAIHWFNKKTLSQSRYRLKASASILLVTYKISYSRLSPSALVVSTSLI